MVEYSDLIKEYENYSKKQFNALRDVRNKIMMITFDLERILSITELKKFTELIYNLKTYDYLLCEDIIKFMIYKINNNDI